MSWLDLSVAFSLGASGGRHPRRGRCICELVLNPLTGPGFPAANSLPNADSESKVLLAKRLRVVFALWPPRGRRVGVATAG